MIPESNEIRVEVTTKCNYDCIICPREELTRKKESMSFKMFKMLFDKINEETAQYDTLTFPGMGEPLLDKSLNKKIDYAKNRGFNVLMLTNGSLLTVDRFKELDALGLDSIRVSLYSNSPEVYRKIHGIQGDSMFAQVKKNLTAICRRKRKTRILLTYNLVENVNDSDLSSWIDYWKDKADLLEAWRPHNWAAGKHYRTVQKKKLKSCGRPFRTPLQVQVDGTINMCCFDFDGKLLLGDLTTHSLKSIFQSKIFNKIVACHKTGKFNNSGLICEMCDQRNVDKSDVMVYNSKFDIAERVKTVSTTYKDIL
jgi:pyruvate-formate lyase-activating enzyme